MVLQIIKALVLISLFTSINAFAADPFLSDSEEGGSYAREIIETKEKIDQNETFSGALAEQEVIVEGEKEKSSFRGTIDKLLNRSKPKEEKEAEWTGFESIEGTEAESKYYETSEYKILQEFSKPIETRKAFGDKLDSIEGALDINKQNQYSSPETTQKYDSFYDNYQ